MSYKLLFLLNALVALIVGLAFLFVPGRALDVFGIAEKYVSTLLAARFFGTVMLALGLILWFAKDVSDAGLQRGMGIALLIGGLSGLIVTIMGTFSGNAVIRSNGWIAILVYLLFSLGYAFLVFMKPRLKV